MKHPLLDKVEDYLLDRLTPQQREEFEANLANPQLKGTMQAQSEIIEALSVRRRAMLKQNLSMVEVSLGYSMARVVGLWAASIGTAAGIASLVWWQTQTQSAVFKTKTIENSMVMANKPIGQNLGSSPNTNGNAAPNALPNPTTSPQKPTIDLIPNKIAHPSSSVPPRTNRFVGKSKIKTEVVEDFDTLNEEPATDQNLKISNNQQPSNGLSVSDKQVSKKPEVVLHQQSSLAYEYFDGKLYLYGDFEQNLYELIELNEINEHLLYLYLQKNYYQLNPTKQKQSLQKIEDALIINKLNILRKKRVE